MKLRGRNGGRRGEVEKNFAEDGRFRENEGMKEAVGIVGMLEG